MRNALNKVRNKELGWIWPNALDIPEILHRNDRGDFFSRYDSGINDTSHIVIFLFDLQEDIFLYLQQNGW